MKKYNNILLLCPNRYSLKNMFSDLLFELSENVVHADSGEFVGDRLQYLQSQMFRFPYSIRDRFERIYLKRVNDGILEKFNQVKPEIVFVYNSEFLLPETCEYFKKSSKIVFFLGDSPFFTPLNNYYLTVLRYGNVILSPDSFWVEQLRTIGYCQTQFFIPGIDTKSYYKIGHSDLNLLSNIRNTEIVYSGLCYVNSWGYKKALFMSKFTDFDFSLYGGKHWKKWLPFFPELTSHFHLKDFVPTEELNQMYNKTKIVPVDGNPGILNGFHIRFFESLSSGAFPLVEYRKDINDILFKNSGFAFPLVDDYRKAASMAAYYINHDDERIDLVNQSFKYIQNEFSTFRNAQHLLDLLDSEN